MYLMLRLTCGYLYKLKFKGHFFVHKIPCVLMHVNLMAEQNKETEPGYRGDINKTLCNGKS